MTATNPTRRVLIICSNYGVEQDELGVPLDQLTRAGVAVTLAAPDLDVVRTLVNDKDPGRTVEPTTTLAEVSSDEHDLLVVPGGTINADSLRLDGHAVSVVGRFAESGRTIAAICHGPWLAVEADVVRGKTLTSYPSLRTDILNAGAASWVDRSVVVDTTDGHLLITSRTPDDLPDFLAAIEEALELDE